MWLIWATLELSLFHLYNFFKVIINNYIGILNFSRESKYEIKGSKSRSVREKNVLYSNLKNAIFKGKS